MTSPRIWRLSCDGFYDYARLESAEAGWPNDLNDNPVRVVEAQPIVEWLARLLTHERGLSKEGPLGFEAETLLSILQNTHETTHDSADDQ